MDIQLQLNVLACLVETGGNVTIRELASACDAAPNTIQVALRELVRKGRIAKHTGIGRPGNTYTIIKG